MVKAETKVIEDGSIESHCEVVGRGEDIIDEAYAAIKVTMTNVKKADVKLHEVLLSGLLNNNSWMAIDNEERKDGIS